MHRQVDKRRVLIIGNDENDPGFISDSLREEGFICDTVDGGQEALEQIKLFKPDIIFLDIILSALDGHRTCKKIKDDPRTRSIPLVMVTMLNDREAWIRGLAAGADDFLIKPIDKTELIIRVKNMLIVAEFEDLLKRRNGLIESEVRKRMPGRKSDYRDA